MTLDYLPFMNANRAKGPRQVVSSRHANAWTPVRTPLRSARVVLLTSAAVRLAEQSAFVPAEDVSYRVVPIDTAPTDLRIDHRSPIGTDARVDLEIVVPRHALTSLAEQGVVGDVAPAFLSFVGGTELHQQIEEQLAPALTDEVRRLGGDLAILVPY
jgi:D-proline reductase (dithiol) PrdB